MPIQDQEHESDIAFRLEKVLHEQQASFQSTRDDVNFLKSTYTVIQRDMMTMTNSIEKLAAHLDESRKVNWPLLALFTGVLPLLIAGFWFFVTSYTSAAMFPVESELRQIETVIKTSADVIKEIGSIQSSRGKNLSLLEQSTTINSEIIKRLSQDVNTIEHTMATGTESETNSKTDRSQLNERLKKLEDLTSKEITERRTQHAETRVQLSEVEQQFHSVSNLENLRAAQQERLNSLMWEKINPGQR